MASTSSVAREEERHGRAGGVDDGVVQLGAQEGSDAECKECGGGRASWTTTWSLLAPMPKTAMAMARSGRDRNLASLALLTSAVSWLLPTDDIDMYVEGNEYSRNTGKAAVWRFREFLPSAPDGQLLWTNTYSSWLFDPQDSNTLYATMTTFLRANCTRVDPCAPPQAQSLTRPPRMPELYPGFCHAPAPTGSLYQLGRWTCKLDPDTGKVRYMHQEVVYALWM